MESAFISKEVCECMHILCHTKKSTDSKTAEVTWIHSKIRKNVQNFLQAVTHENGIRLFWIRLSVFDDERNAFHMKQNETEPISIRDERTMSIFLISCFGICLALICF